MALNETACRDFTGDVSDLAAQWKPNALPAAEESTTNMLSTESELAHIHTSITERERSLAELNAEMDSIAELHRHLTQERDDAVIALEMEKAGLRPILRVPAELLLKIFTMALYRPNKKAQDRCLMAIHYVCRGFTTLLRGSGSIYNTYQIFTTPLQRPLEVYVQGLGDSLKRAKGCPLTLELHERDPFREIKWDMPPRTNVPTFVLMKMFLAHVRQWGALKIHGIDLEPFVDQIRGLVPVLTTLEIRWNDILDHARDLDCFAVLPALRDVSFIYHTPTDCTTTVVPWAQLRRLTLHTATTNSVLSVLSETHALEYLSLKPASERDDFAPSDTREILLPSLTTLDLLVEQCKHLSLLARLRGPNLEEVTCHITGAYAPDVAFVQLVDMLNPARTTLRSLTLSLGSNAVSEAGWRSFFASLPNVEYLNVKANRLELTPDLLHLLVRVQGALDALPCLTDATLTGVAITVANVEKFLDIIESRNGEMTVGLASMRRLNWGYQELDGCTFTDGVDFMAENRLNALYDGRARLDFTNCTRFV